MAVTIDQARKVLDLTAKDGDYETHSEGTNWDDMVEQISQLIRSIVTDDFDTPPNGLPNDPLTHDKRTVEGLLDEVLDLLKENFPTGPPFTVQRLAELLTTPTQHYPRSAVAKYLSALKTTFSVTSEASDFPKKSLQEEIDSSKNENTGESFTDSAVVMTDITWVIDTGTPPPDSLEHEDENEVSRNGNGDDGHIHKRHQPNSLAENGLEEHEQPSQPTEDAFDTGLVAETNVHDLPDHVEAAPESNQSTLHDTVTTDSQNEAHPVDSLTTTDPSADYTAEDYSSTENYST